MPKRNATSELNHDNWNDDDEPEEAGTFQKAAPDIIGKRVIKSARRRGVSNTSSSGGVFAGFQGFSKTPESSSPFSFLKKSEPANGSSVSKNESTAVSKTLDMNSGTSMPTAPPPTPTLPTSSTDPREPSPPYTETYLAAVKKLNECFVKHIQTCFEENEYVIFSPCFRDYEKHLKEILCLNSAEANQTSDSFASAQPFGSETQNADNAGGFNFFSGSVKTANSGTEFKIAPEKGVGTSPAASVLSSAKEDKQGSWFSKADNFPSLPTTKLTAGDPDDENEEPTKVEFTAVVEDGAVYSRRCKVFVKKDNTYQDHGVGMLYLKPVEEGKKTQLIVRADTSLGNVLLNTLLNSDMSMQKMGKNNVMFCCVPTPDYKPQKPIPVLLRVKTSDDADELLKKMNELTK